MKTSNNDFGGSISWAIHDIVKDLKEIKERNNKQYNLYIKQLQTDLRPELMNRILKNLGEREKVRLNDP